MRTTGLPAFAPFQNPGVFFLPVQHSCPPPSFTVFRMKTLESKNGREKIEKGGGFWLYYWLA
jgi:hypothetical protein